jgi:hypothetical protein
MKSEKLVPTSKLPDNHVSEAYQVAWILGLDYDLKGNLTKSLVIEVCKRYATARVYYGAQTRFCFSDGSGIVVNLSNWQLARHSSLEIARNMKLSFS